MNLKKLLPAVLLLASTSVVADSMLKVSVKSRDYTCADLQELVRQESHVVLSGFLNSKARVYPTSENCKSVHDLRPTKPSWKTKDTRFCIAGFVCQPIWYIHSS